MAGAVSHCGCLGHECRDSGLRAAPSRRGKAGQRRAAEQRRQGNGDRAALTRAVGPLLLGLLGLLPAGLASMAVKRGTREREDDLEAIGHAATQRHLSVLAAECLTEL